jgi:hypothetical protein
MRQACANYITKIVYVLTQVTDFLTRKISKVDVITDIGTYSTRQFASDYLSLCHRYCNLKTPHLDFVFGPRRSGCFLKGIRMTLNVCFDSHTYHCNR